VTLTISWGNTGQNTR